MSCKEKTIDNCLRCIKLISCNEDAIFQRRIKSSEKNDRVEYVAARKIPREYLSRKSGI